MLQELSDKNTGLDTNNNNIIMSYSPNDWYYLAVIKDSSGDMPTSTDCENVFPYSNWDSSCNTHYNDYPGKCMQVALCRNQDESKILDSLESKNVGVDRKMNDDSKVYYNTIVNTANLGIGIAILLGIIYNTVYSKSPLAS